MSEYAGICVDMPKSTWMAFVLFFPIEILCLVEPMVTYFNVYTKLEVIIRSCYETRGYFLEETKFDFFYSSWKYLISYLY